MILPLPPPSEIAQAPLPLEVAALDFCRGVAPQMGWEAKANPSALKALRHQATSLLEVCARALPPENRALPLLGAALGALESATGEEAKGEKRYGRAARTLALRWRNAQKAWGASSPRCLPELESLILLYELGGMRASLWRDETLRIRVNQARVPDPVLEQDLAAAVEDHYGPWLTVVELEPMLEFSHHLARIWGSHGEDRAMTRRILTLGLRPDAHRVWRLAARKATEGLRLQLARLLARLDPEAILREDAQGAGGVDSVLRLGEALMGTPLEGAARELLKRLDVALFQESLVPRRDLRRRIARILQDWTGWASQLREELAPAESSEVIASLLGEAEPFLREHRDGGLLDLGTRKLRALAQGQGPADPELARRLEAWAELQTDPFEAEDLRRLRLALEDPEGRDWSARCELLARLGRWKDLEEVLEASPQRESEAVLGWRFRTALAQGEGQGALSRLEAWLARVTGPEAPEEPPLLPGLCWAFPRLRDRAEVLGPLVARFGARLLPGQEALLAREPWRILAALDPEAPASLLPTRAEEALRWRWSRLPSGEPRRRLLEALLRDAEGQLGAAHLLVAELLVELGEAQKEDGLPALERAQRILESAPGQEQLLARVHLAMAAACSLLDGPGLERNLLKAMALLERMPRLGAEAEEWVREMPGLLLLHLWREQRLDELLVLAPRVQALARRSMKPSPAAGELGTALTALARVARLQGQLRGAGLP